MDGPNVVSVTEAQKIIGMGRTKLYALLKTGKIRAYKHGKRTLIFKYDLEEFLKNLERYPTEGGEENV